MSRRRKAAVKPVEPEIEVEETQEAAGENKDKTQYIRNLNEFICVTPLKNLNEEQIKLSLQRSLNAKHKAIEEMVDKYTAEGFSLEEINNNCSVVSQLMPTIEIVNGKPILTHKFELVGLE